MSETRAYRAGAMPTAFAPRSATFAREGALRRAAALAAVVVLVTALGGWHLDRYPRTWFDEGIYLQVARNLVERHEYVAISANGMRDYAPVIGVGPTVLVPVAAAMWLGGVSLEAARLVPLLYLSLATALLFAVSRALFGTRAAGVTIGAALIMPSLDWVVTGRQVLGEVPAVAFLLLGGVLAMRARSLTVTAVAGMVLGLSMVTKGQYVLILPTAIVVVALVDRMDTRRRPWRWHITLLAGALTAYGAWIGGLLVVLGDGQVVENVRMLRQSSAGALLVFNAQRMLSGLKLLLGPGSLLLVAPSLVAGWLATRQARGDRRLALTSILVFQVLWLGWFAFASIAWPRYAFPGLALNTIFTGALLATGLDTASRWSLPRASTIARSITLLAVVAVVAAGLWRELSPIVRADEREPQQFAALLDRMTPDRALVDGWEPEIGFLSAATIQYPPLGSLDRMVRARWLGQPTSFDMSPALSGEYLIVGPFARWVGVYAEALASERYRLLGAVGGYALYERVDRYGEATKHE